MEYVVSFGYYLIVHESIEWLCSIFLSVPSDSLSNVEWGPENDAFIILRIFDWYQQKTPDTYAISVRREKSAGRRIRNITHPSLAQALADGRELEKFSEYSL